MKDIKSFYQILLIGAKGPRNFNTIESYLQQHSEGTTLGSLHCVFLEHELMLLFILGSYFSCCEGIMSSSHKHKLDLQPFVEEMYEELECEKTVIKKFRKYYKMVGISLEQGGSRLGKLNENEYRKAWSESRVQYLVRLQELMTCQRFELIGTFLHIVTVEEEEAAKDNQLRKIQPIYDHIK